MQGFLNMLFKILKYYFKRDRINLQIHYSMLAAGGFILGMIREKINPFEINYFKFFFSILTILVAFYSSLVFNDIYDFEGDKIVKKLTPLTEGIIERTFYFKFGLIFMIFSILFSFFLNIYALLNIVILHILQIIYTFPPLRLKRVYPISIFILSLAALFSMLFGFSVIEEKEKFFLRNFPFKLYLIFLFAFPFAMNFRDVLDLKGDKFQGVKTLAVIVGEEKAPFFAGLTLFITYMLVALILLKPIFFILSIIAGILSIVFSLRKNYEEFPFFIIYFSYLLIFIVIVYLNPEYLF